MKVVLLEKVERLGRMGDVVDVRPGFANNFLLPRRKALRATANNLAYFEGERAKLEAENLRHRSSAEEKAKAIEGLSLILIRQASETGHLYGSVSARDVADAVSEVHFPIERSQIRIDRPIKDVGLHRVRLVLHPEIFADIKISIAQTEEEAKALLEGKSKKSEKAEAEKRSFEKPAAEEASA